MITLLVSYYAEDPEPAILSAQRWLPIDRVVAKEGRWKGFPPLQGEEMAGAPFASEHHKRNVMLAEAGPADPDRWLMILDCDELVLYASPSIGLQLERCEQDVAGVVFVDPLWPDAPGLEHPGRRVRDHIVEAFPRLIRHLPELAFTYRHDHLENTRTGSLLIGWESERPQPPAQVDVTVLHTRKQSDERVAAKHEFYSGPHRQLESRPVVEPGGKP